MVLLNAVFFAAGFFVCDALLEELVECGAELFEFVFGHGEAAG